MDGWEVPGFGVGLGVTTGLRSPVLVWGRVSTVQSISGTVNTGSVVPPLSEEKEENWILPSDPWSNKVHFSTPHLPTTLRSGPNK